MLFGDTFLVGRVHGSDEWSLPKGVYDESDLDLKHTAVRELEEETGYKLKPEQLEYVGIFPYRPNKDFALFKYESKNQLNTDDMVCTTYYKNPYNKQSYPEIDKYMFFNFNDMNEYMNYDQCDILRKYLEKERNKYE